MLRLSTKSDYGFILIVSLAEKRRKGFISLKTVASEKKLPFHYLSQLVISLKRAGLIKSKEGRKGGYILARSPDQITLKEILKALEGEINLVKCMKKNCLNKKFCLTKNIWFEVRKDINKKLSNLTLKDLINT